MSGTFSRKGIGLPLVALIGVFLVIVTDIKVEETAFFSLFPVLHIQSMK